MILVLQILDLNGHFQRDEQKILHRKSQFTSNSYLLLKFLCLEIYFRHDNSELEWTAEFAE